MSKKIIADQVIIVGGGFAGLLAARVLSDHFKKIIIIEKDLISDEHVFDARAGVPQAQQSHFLTTRGAEVVQNLFPDFEKTLVAHGGHKVDLMLDWKHFQQGHWMPRFAGNKSLYIQSRPLLEGCIRSLLKNDNIEYFYQHEAIGLLANPKLNRITGVRCKNLKNNEELNIYADLIIDTSGRTSHFPEWLEGLGYQKPEREEVMIDVVYLSRQFLLPENYQPDWSLLTIFRTIPKKKSATTVLLESTSNKKTCLVTLMGQHGDFPVNSEEGFFDFAQQLETPELYNLLRESTPISPLLPFKIPVCWRLHYETMSKLPSGLITIGDSMCAMDPIYGQGMSTAALETKLLADILAANVDGKVETICRDYYKLVNSVLDNPWKSQSFIDFLYPETIGKRPFGFTLKKYYYNLVVKALRDPFVWQRLVELKNLEKSQRSLYSPRMLVKVLPKIFS